MRNFLIIFTTAAVLALSLGAVVNVHEASKPGRKHDFVSSSTEAVKDQVENFIHDETDDDLDDDGEGVFDPETVTDGFPIRLVTSAESYDLLDEEDKIVPGKLDLEVAVRELQARQTKTGDDEPKRKKRWAGVYRNVFNKINILIRGSTQIGRMSIRGSTVTQQYQRRGNYNTALRDFNRFNPPNQSSSSGRVRGRTGTASNYSITVRDGSNGGSPTLEIRARNGRQTLVYKFRYGQSRN